MSFGTAVGCAWGGLEQFSARLPDHLAFNLHWLLGTVVHVSTHEHRECYSWPAGSPHVCPVQ